MIGEKPTCKMEAAALQALRMVQFSELSSILCSSRRLAGFGNPLPSTIGSIGWLTEGSLGRCNRTCLRKGLRIKGLYESGMGQDFERMEWVRETEKVTS